MTEKGNTMAGLTSLPRKMNIKGQPHNLAYITKAESDLLKSIGGAGKPRKGTKGVPSYDFADVGVDDYDVMGSDAQAEADAAQEAADAAFDDSNMGQDFDLMNQFDPTLGIAAPSPNEMNTIAMLSAQTPTQAMAERESLANAVAEAQSAGVISYNEALDFGKHGYLNLLEQVEREDDLATARGIEGLYGLREGDVTPAPVGGFSYQGPGSTRAALSEIGKGAIDAGSLLAEGYMNLPGLGTFLSALGLTDFNKAGKAIGETVGLREKDQEGLVESQIGKGFAQSVKDELTSWGRGEAPPTISEQVAAAPEGYNPAIGMADPNIAGLPGVSFPGHISTLGIANTVSPEAYEAYHNAMFDLRDLKGYEFGPEYGLSPTANMGLQPVGAATPEQAPSSVQTPSEKSAADYFAAFAGPPSQPTSLSGAEEAFYAPADLQQRSAVDFYGGIPDGNEIIPRFIPETPTATPVVEEEVNIATATPRTRTAATDTFRILVDTYGPEVAAQLLPNRIV